jgi:hypothetical protein
LNPSRKRGCITIAIAGQIVSRDRRLAFFDATDDLGRDVPLAPPVREAVILPSGTQIPYSLVFAVPEGAHELNLVVAISQTRVFEFLAKPEQIRE